MLAIAVVLTHAGAIFGYKYLDGVMAVQSFFIISGFYMTMILNEKYNFRGAYKMFLSNRILRLFPTYLLILLLTFLVGCIFSDLQPVQDFKAGFAKLDLFAQIYMVVINLTLVGQDTALFFAANPDGSLYFVKNFQEASMPLYPFLLCPPAWTLSLELIFYALAPFIVRKKLPLILVLMALSMALRIIIYSNGMFHDPWVYRFFPNELFFFLAGYIAYKIYKNIGTKAPLVPGRPLLVVIILFTLAFNYIPGPYLVKQYLYYGLFTLSVPYIFNYTKNFKMDRYIGELSYPVYLSHVFIIYFCIPAITEPLGLQKLNSILAVILSVIFSILLIKLLIQPIDNYRARRIKKLKGS